ncbi:MAG: hypothetical protein R3303_03095, partial [Marinobacter sp.]|nr:hypothetical protein [Marinobacter sp.]
MSFLNQPSLRALRLTARPLLWLWLASGALAVGSAGATEPDTPARVRDLAYGTVLYEYYQGNAFEALSRLSVADARGGIIGHGANPELVEGGLMLAYGMTREARALFESMLDGQVTSSRRNQAWFYLGKVLYLEDDKAGANGALAHVEPEALAEEAPGLYPEWLYLRGQLALQTGQAGVSEWLAKMPDDNLWGAYLRYNRAIRQVTDGQRAPAIDGLTVLAEQLAQTLDRQPDRNDTAERQALRDRTLLTVGQLQLEAGDETQARAVLAKIRLDSVFSDEALFHFAVAAAHDRDFGLALRALDTLQRRPLFTPWLQQVPYARGFVFEQMGHQQQALDAYRSAAEHYQSLSGQLAREQANLSETRLNDA